MAVFLTHDINLLVVVAFKWFVSQTPYLIHDHPIAPHITGCGVLPIVQSLPIRTQLYNTRLVATHSTLITSGAVHFRGITPPLAT